MTALSRMMPTWLVTFLIGCTPVAMGASLEAPRSLPTLAPTVVLPTSPSAPGEVLPPLPPTNTPFPTATPPIQTALVTPRPESTIPLLPTGEAQWSGPGASSAVTPAFAVDDPDYTGRSIDALTAREYGTGSFSITETLDDEGTFMRYAFEYDSDGERVTGFLNVPHEGTRMPVALVLHGYVNPAEYELLAYTTHYADALAEAGYMVFHPSYRNHPVQEGGGTGEVSYNTFRIDYAVDVLHLTALIRKGALDPTGPLRRADGEHIHVLGHSMGGGIAQRVMTVRPDWYRAVVLYASMSGDESLNYDKIRSWAGERAWEKEVYAPPEIVRAVSPIHYIERWIAPVSVHHGTDDGIVPSMWSRELCELLEGRRYPVTCFEYRNYPHNFYGAADALFIERLIDFFKSN